MTIQMNPDALLAEIAELETTISSLKEERDELKAEMVHKNRMIRIAAGHIKGLQGLVSQRSKFPR